MLGDEHIKILYIEDEPEAFLFLKTLLKRKIQTIVDLIWASNGKEGLSILRKKDVDFILLDFLLPDMSGLRVLEKIRQEGIIAPVVMITGNGDEKVASEAFKKGVIDYMVKKFDDIDGLAERLRSYINFTSWISKEKNEFKKFESISKKRDSFVILADILRNAVNGTKKTQLIYKSNLNSETIKKYIWYSMKNEYLQWRREGKEGIFVTTTKGMELLNKMDDIMKLLA